MYKLFLCLRYLWTRAIAYFAVVGVALCVAMVLIVISVMNGFLDKIESAARGLFGDVTVAATSLGGMKYYGEFAAHLRREVPEVQAVSPLIRTVGIIRVPGFDYRHTVQVVGVYLPGGGPKIDGGTDYYTAVSRFEGGLFVQHGAGAGFTPSEADLVKALTADMSLLKRIDERYPNDAETQRSIETAMIFHEQGLDTVRNADYAAAAIGEFQQLRARVDEARNATPSTEDILALRGLVQTRLNEAGKRILKVNSVLWRMHDMPWAGDASDLLSLSDIVDEAISIIRDESFEPAGSRAILGLGIPGMVERTPEGETIRKIVPGGKVVISMAPLGRKSVSGASVTPVSASFTVVDDCRTDVWQVDSATVYVPFQTLQKLNDMDAPDRCGELMIRLQPAYSDGLALWEARKKIVEALDSFMADPAHADMTDMGAPPTVQTWRQSQAKLISSLENQRTLSVIMFGVISLVAVVLVFVIFYMIVVQKTRDIGVLKAIGASNAGVAGIFLAYGAAIGLVGSVLGTVGGYYFVRYINVIRDWLGDTFGFQPYSKEWYIFEEIPNQVNTSTAVWIVVAAIVAGVVGALIPSVRAARMQPVEALRYE